MNNWKQVVLQNNKSYLKATFKFKNYLEAQNFVNLVAQIAQSSNHHPEIHWKFLQVTIISYTIDEGKKITDLDYILTQKISKKFNEILNK